MGTNCGSVFCHERIKDADGEPIERPVDIEFLDEDDLLGQSEIDLRRKP